MTSIGKDIKKLKLWCIVADTVKCPKYNRRKYRDS